MAKKQLVVEPTGARFEYRVWGTHRRARKMLETLADEQSTEHVDDCDVLVEDSALNVRVVSGFEDRSPQRGGAEALPHTSRTFSYTPWS